MRKMKDIRGSNVAAVRTAIYRKFKVQSTSKKGRRNSNEFMVWKNSKEVGNCHKNVFTDKVELEDLTMSAFPLLSDVSDEKFTDFYIYIASVCDIILNPKYQAQEVFKKPLELRLRRFRVFIDIFFII